MRKDIFDRELLNEKVIGNFKVTITKLISRYDLSDIRYLVSVDNGNPIPMFSRSYKTLAVAKREYNTWG